MELDDFQFEPAVKRGILHRNEKSHSVLGSSRQSLKIATLNEPEKRGSTYQPGLGNCPLMRRMKTEGDLELKPTNTTASRIKPNLHASSKSTGQLTIPPVTRNANRKLSFVQDEPSACATGLHFQDAPIAFQNDLALDQSEGEEQEGKNCNAEQIISQETLFLDSTAEKTITLLDNSPSHQQTRETKGEKNSLLLQPATFDIHQVLNQSSYFKQPANEPKNVLTYGQFLSKRTNECKIVVPIEAPNDNLLPSLASPTGLNSLGEPQQYDFRQGKFSSSNYSVSLTIKKCYLVIENVCKSIILSQHKCKISFFSNFLLLRMNHPAKDKTIKLRVTEIVKIYGCFHRTFQDHFLFLIRFVDIPRELCEYVSSHYQYYSIDQNAPTKGELLVVCRNVSNPLKLPLECRFYPVELDKFEQLVGKISNFDICTLTCTPLSTPSRNQASRHQSRTPEELERQLPSRKTRLQSPLKIAEYLGHSPKKSTSTPAPQGIRRNLQRTNEHSLSSPAGKEPDSNLSTRSNLIILSYPFDERPSGNNTTIFQSDLARLRPNVYLNDSLLSLYLIHLEEQYAAQYDVHFFNTHFYSRLANKGSQQALKWLRDPILEKKYWIMPINEALHWYLAIVCFPCSSIGLYDDSLNTLHNSKPTTYILVFNSLNAYRHTNDIYVTNKIVQFIEALADEMQVPLLSNWTYQSFFPSNVPQQTNTHDCGCFLLENAEMFLKEGPEQSLSTFLALNAVYKEKEVDIPMWYPVANARKKRGQIERLLRQLQRDPRNTAQLVCDLASQKETSDSEEVEELSEREYKILLQKSVDSD